MAQAIENSTDLETRIIGPAGPSSIPGYDLVTVQLVAAQSVEGKFDVLSGRVGEQLDISIPHGRYPSQDVSGFLWSVRASLVGPGVVTVDDSGAGIIDVRPAIER